MSTAVTTNPPAQPKAAKQAKPPQSFLDKHFAKVAFAVATFAMLLLAPLHLFLGLAAGMVIQYLVEPNLRLTPSDRVITLPNAVFAIVGATAALLRLTPAGSLGGFIFKAIPFLASLAVGSTAYRAARSVVVLDNL